MESKEIQSFREQWKSEINTVNSEKGKQENLQEKDTNLKLEPNVELHDNGLVADEEKEAANLFNHGVWLEGQGEVYNAIKYYRRAIALVPDIEFKVYKQNIIDRNEGLQTNDSEEALDDKDEMNLSNLVLHFESMFRSLPLCETMFTQQATHISSLPTEMLEYILSWVVGDQLDLQSLDCLSSVCRGFFLLCRDPDLWKRACLCTWGINTGDAEIYGSWRDMFIMRPRLKFNGCYISKTIYFRRGESSFQDHFYEPYQEVIYYRYMRFFPNGLVVMLTSTDEPQQVVSQLKDISSKNMQVMQGHYRLFNDKVSILFRRPYSHKLNNRGRNKRRELGPNILVEDTFNIEMEINPSKRRLHCQLVWQSYQIINTYASGKHASSTMDVQNENNFPSLIFSRVKSYMKQSNAPLP